ncbi:MAG: acyclic terpene utilization AtuA family protein, partial [Alphaproteobacteria bacterium]
LVDRVLNEKGPDAAEAVAALAARMGLAPRIAAVLGDDVLDRVEPGLELDDGRRVRDLGEVVSANAYLGAEALLDGLRTGADIVISGRVADPSLALAPLMHVHGWSADDWRLMARGTAVGHLLECAGQLTGGYFADPGRKDVPDLARLGFPFADVWPDGRAILGKPAGSGGRLDLRTAKEQLLYEVLDPRAYLTPDSSADFTSIALRDLGDDRVEMTGGDGAPRPGLLKVSVGYRAGYIGEGEISYAGPGAEARARMGGEIVRARLGDGYEDLRVDLVGIDSTHGRSWGNRPEAWEARLRVAGRARSAAMAARVGEEVEALYCNGPAGGGGARKYMREVVGVASAYIPRAMAPHAVVEVRP